VGFAVSVKGFGCWVPRCAKHLLNLQGLGFEVWRLAGFGFLGFRGWGLGFGVEGLGFVFGWFAGFGFFGFWVWGWGFGFEGLGLRVWGQGFEVWDLGSRFGF